MRNHIKLYHETLDIGFYDGVFRPSELSGAQSNDIHHIDCRGMGGSKIADRIENLMALTTEEHLEYGDKKQYVAMLYRRHLQFLKWKNVEFDEDWINSQIYKYSIYE